MGSFLYCYFLLIFIPVNCTFKTWFQLLQTFALPWVDKVTTGTNATGLVSVLVNYGTWMLTGTSIIRRFVALHKICKNVGFH